MPRFSIVTPVYETPADVLRAMLVSVRAQTFGDWELCLVDDASTSAHVHEILAHAAKDDPRVRVSHRAANGGIVATSNDALAMAQGEFVALLDHDDELHPRALALVAEALAADPDVDYVYTDEDKIDLAGRHSGAFYKPDWSPERFRTQMYTRHLSVLRRSLVDEVGGFDAEFEGSQDWDLVLKVTERARAVVHVPEVLYHWRMLETSAAGAGEEAKPWAYAAGQRAVQAHCRRIGLPAQVERDAHDPGVYHLRAVLERKPPVSIIIPTGGHRREVRAERIVLVTHCVRSILATSTYDDYEIVCVADTSTPREVLGELDAIGGDRLRVVMFDRPFSFSAKINVGAIHSRGEHLLLLNDGMEIVTPDWIERMVMYSDFPGIGVVGSRLLYPDGRLQHAGVVFIDARPGHLYRGFSNEFTGFSNNVLLAQNYLAVTGACLTTPRDLFAKVGGLSADLPINYGDIDYCLKVRAEGHRVVYDPDTVLYHFETSSRLPHVEEWELIRFMSRWRAQTDPDPYVNPNFLPRSFHLVPPVQLADGTAA
jgi:glycosyltransferase involved in cell wall biosynthesis